VILAVQDVLDMRDDCVFKVASGLIGGIGLMDDTCGALLGASLMLGLKYGRGREEIDNLKKLANSTEPVGKLYKWFEKEFGSATCREVRTKLHGGVFYDLKVPWQYDLAMEDGHLEKCSDITGKTAAKTVEMLWEDEAGKK
jgi:C_GCAxxG_C_C family probable redox protein